MPFSEADKVEVKRKAGFRCCMCQQMGVEVHHILPEKHGGTDHIGNAAPLCPNCHNYFGDNPIKRKEITQMRDWWYGVAKIKYPGLPVMIMTAFAEGDTAGLAITGGARDFIKKPFDLNEFSVRLHKMINDSEVQRRMKSEKDVDDGMRKLLDELEASLKEI
jgi:hypothetical protein